MTMHPMQEYIQKLSNNKLFANLEAKLFQETGGLLRWQELINEKKNN